MSPSSPSATSVTTTATTIRAAAGVARDGEQRKRGTRRERQRRRPRGLDWAGPGELVEAELVARMRLERTTTDIARATSSASAGAPPSLVDPGELA